MKAVSRMVCDIAFSSPLVCALRTADRQRLGSGLARFRFRLDGATPWLDFRTSEARSGNGFDELEAAGPGRRRPIRQAREIARDHLDGVEFAAILVLDDRDGLRRHSVNEIGIAR